MPKRPRARKGVWSRVVLVAVGTLGGFFLAEAMLALILPQPIVWQAPQERYENHPTRFFDLRPNQKAFTHDKPIRVNALGFRGAEVEIPKPEGYFRITVIGDSITFGNGVADDETYSAQVERMLRGAGLRDVEVINAGIPAYDTWQEVLLLEEVVFSLEPDLVVLGFYENDISRRPRTIYPIINQDGEPPRTGIRAWLGDRWIAFIKSSRLLLLAREAYQRTRARWLPSAASTRRMALLNGDHNPSLESGWAEVKKSLRHMDALLKRAGIPLRIVVFPMPEQVWNTGANTAAYQTRLQEITGEIGVPTLDLLPVFRKAAVDGRPLYIFWDWHLNGEGHKVAAQAIEPFIRPVVAQWMAKNSIPHSSQ